MKKFLLLVFSLVLVFIFYSKNQQDISLVFNENEYIDNYDHDYFYVFANDILLNTNNLIDYFNNTDIKIIGIYPKLDNIYENDLKKKLDYYAFSSLYNNRTNINNFTNYYVNILKNNNYIDMANLVYFDGINIDKIVIYASYNSIYLHDLKYKNFKYKIKEF